jgi:hypothetical protein
MGDGSINRNHQIEVRYHCRSVSKIAERTPHIVEDHTGRRLVYLPRRRAGLQTEQRQVWEVRQRRQGCQRAGAIPVILVGRIAGPYETDPKGLLRP